MLRSLLPFALIVSAAAAQADITVKFVESAPKDRFIIKNTSACAETAVDIRIDLAGSAAGLIFDTTSAGAGVEVFQPFELVRGANLVTGAPDVSDGETDVTLRLSAFPAGGEVAFTVDVDDTLATSDLGQIRVSGSEIAGAQISIGGDTAVFGSDAMATLPRTICNA